MKRRDVFSVETRGRSTQELTSRVQDVVRGSGVRDGMVNIFVHHTSASLMLCENADPDVQSDMERFFSHLVPDGDPMFEHTAEGPDDMSAHVRSVLTTNSLSVPVADGRMTLGTWQGIYLWEHRAHPHSRRVTVSVSSLE